MGGWVFCFVFCYFVLFVVCFGFGGFSVLFVCCWVFCCCFFFFGGGGGGGEVWCETHEGARLKKFFLKKGLRRGVVSHQCGLFITGPAVVVVLISTLSTASQQDIFCVTNYKVRRCTVNVVLVLCSVPVSASR